MADVKNSDGVCCWISQQILCCLDIATSLI